MLNDYCLYKVMITAEIFELIIRFSKPWMSTFLNTYVSVFITVEKVANNVKCNRIVGLVFKLNTTSKRVLRTAEDNNVHAQNRPSTNKIAS